MEVFSKTVELVTNPDDSTEVDDWMTNTVNNSVLKTTKVKQFTVLVIKIILYAILQLLI